MLLRMKLDVGGSVIPNLSCSPADTATSVDLYFSSKH
jgi:hypothetical protein